jgi:hypothetical protein
MRHQRLPNSPAQRQGPSLSSCGTLAAEIKFGRTREIVVGSSRKGRGVAVQPDPGQHEEHEPVSPVIVHVHAWPPLYAHVQLEPVHSDCQTLPALS